MIELTPFTGYNLLMAAFAAVGACALRHYDEGIPSSRNLSTAVGGSLLFAVVGLFDPVASDLRRGG